MEMVFAIVVLTIICQTIENVNREIQKRISSNFAMKTFSP